MLADKDKIPIKRNNLAKNINPASYFNLITKKKSINRKVLGKTSAQLETINLRQIHLEAARMANEE